MFHARFQIITQQFIVKSHQNNVVCFCFKEHYLNRYKNHLTTYSLCFIIIIILV